MMEGPPPAPRADEFKSDAKSNAIFGHCAAADAKPHYQSAHDCDILLNNFQIKKKRFKVLLNRDHLVWERADLKCCSNAKSKAPNGKEAPAGGQAATNAAHNDAALAKKEAEYEKEKLSYEAAHGNLSNAIRIHDIIRVAKGATKSVSVRNAHIPLEKPDDGRTANPPTAATHTDQYLSIYYAERIVASPIDCNRWHVRRLTLHNSDPYIVAQWHKELMERLRRSGRLLIRRLLVFINPYGGRKMGLNTYERTCKPIIQLAGIDASCIITQRANQIRDILLSHDLGQYDALCCVGGDGTVAEMINGLILRAMQDRGIDLRNPAYIPKPTLPIGVIPAGSTDTIAYSLHGTSDVQTAAIHLVLGQRRGLDVCSVKNRDGLVRFCTSLMGYGYLGDVAAKSEKYRWMGTKRYEYTGIKSFLLNRGYEAEVHMLLADDEVTESTENFLNKEIICNVACETCKSPELEDDDKPSSSSMASLSSGQRKLDKRIEHSQNANQTDCDKYDSYQPLDDSMQAKALTKQSNDIKDGDERPISPESASSSSSSNAVTLSETPTSSSPSELANETRKWRIIRGDFFMIVAANISCSCGRSPNGMSKYSHLGDGHMDVILVRKTSLINNLRFVINSMGRAGDIRNLPFVEVYRTKNFLFKTKSNHWLQDYNSVRGSCQPIAESFAESEQNVPPTPYSSWNCDGEVVTDLDISITSHRQLVDVFMRGPYIYRKPPKTKSRFCCCCCCSETSEVHD